jgi:hypothetical protein
MTCNASSTAECGPYHNTGTVTATTVETPPTALSASDSSSYAGVENPKIQLETSVQDPRNGAFVDADTETGPIYKAYFNTNVSFEFTVTNTGNTEVSNIRINDELAERCPGLPPSKLSPGKSYQCSFSANFSSSVFSPQMHNHGTATALSRCGSPLTSSDLTFFEVAEP